jgi:hypothetical protein
MNSPSVAEGSALWVEKGQEGGDVGHEEDNRDKEGSSQRCTVPYNLGEGRDDSTAFHMEHSSGWKAGWGRTIVARGRAHVVMRT